jgi:MFS superfamily sulfate permease-like transporter
VVILNVDFGLYIGIGCNIIFVVMREQFSGHLIRKMVKSTDRREEFVEESGFVKFISNGELNREGNNDAELNRPLNLKIFKIEHSIFFPNCDFFHENFYKKYDELSHDEHVALIEKMISRNRMINHGTNDPRDKINETTALRNDSDYHESDAACLPDCLLDFSAVNYVDTNGVKMLVNLIDDFKKINVFIYICQPQGDL